jgi:uncharacterized membrane protein
LTTGSLLGRVRVRRKIVTVMVVTAVLAVGLFALPLAVLVAKYLIDDERSELTQAADLTALSATASLARGHTPTILPVTESDISLTFYDRSGRRVLGSGPMIADPGVHAAMDGTRVTDGDPGGDFTVDVPVSDDDASRARCAPPAPAPTLGCASSPRG